MTIRALNTTLKNSLLNYDPFIIAHLIKFEKPQSVSQYGGKLQGLATDYTYITDAQYDITYQDGSSSLNSSTPHPAQIYRANKITKIGTINESIQAKASNLSLTLDTASLGATATTSATFTASKMTGTVDLAEKGFQEGDKILLSGSGTTNAGAYIRIDSFEDEGKTIVFTQISSITANNSAQTYTITLSAEEINILLADKGSSSYTSYINREVTIYKVHINPETREIIGGTNGPFLYFKGITSGASINEKVDSSEITWTLSSHWGDFVRVQGRLTDDATHRALRSDGTPDIESVIRPEYAGDLGFLHANTAINHLATYNTTDIEYEQVDINGGWFGGKRLREVEVDVPRQVDLQFNIQSKMLPVIYGVRKVDSFPIFVDTHKNSSAEVYKVDAICEGPIAGVLDIYVEDNSTICLDSADFDSRSPSGANYGDGSSVEIKCAGRMDRGDTLAHASINTAGNQAYPLSYLDNDYTYYENMSFFRNVNYGQAAQGTSVGTGASATGIRHEGTHSITSPLDASFTFHAGLENQKANNTLVSLASNSSFKVQNSYYTGKAQYWGPSHRLLDTAYVVGKYTIAEGETSIPDMKFVVRGRDPECYNYDGSYKHDNTTGAGQNAASFNLGDSVTLKKVNGSMSDTSVTIIDKWHTFDTDGTLDYRFRFSPEPSLGTTTSFYMQNASNNTWHMQTWDHAETVDSPGGYFLHTTLSVATGTARGLKITLTSPSSSFQFAVSNANAILGLVKFTNSGLLASNYSDFTYSSNIIDNITRFSSNPGIDGVYVKNAIQLDSSTASSTDDYYNGNKITLTSGLNTSAPYIQERTIIDYDGSTKVAIVSSPWDYNHQPNTTNQTYSIGSIGDRRVTINPAMQLLDYMTNKRYGKGLDIVEDINIDSWKNAAKECDTRSEVTIAMATSGTTVAPGQIWRYPQSGPVQFMGTVKSQITLGGKLRVIFKDVVGKLGTKWNSWQSFASGELYWYEGSVYAGTGSTVPSAPSSGALTGVTLYTGSSSSRAVDISSASANGNPLVKGYSFRNSNYSDSGYSLYDADDVQYWRYVGWDDSSQRNVTRHQMNQVVDTKLPVFDNINRMLTQFNGILRYSVGKYELEIKSKAGTVHVAEQISNEDIIGTIKLSDKGLKNSKNYVSTSIIDPNNKFEGRSISFFNSDYLKEDKGIQKKGQFSLPGITNYFNARFNIKQYLDESRYGLTVQFTVAPRGLLLVAGSIIEFTYPRFGYSSKQFRITNLNFKKDGTVDVTADEHNDNAYVIEEAGNGSGIVEELAPGQGPGALPIPSRPTGLIATQGNQGEVILTWTNTAAFSSATHLVEIYRSATNNFAAVDSNGDLLATLIGTSTVDTFHDPISEGSGLKTRYYWIRYMVKTPRLNLAGSEFKNVPSLYFPNTDDSGYTNGEGITGIGLAVNAVRSIKLNPGTTQSFVYQNDETGIQSGYDTSTNMTATTTNTGGTVSYVWKNNGTVISGQTGASYTYTPPNSFSDMPETISVEMTDTVGSETFTASDSITFTATKIVVNGQAAIDGFTVTASAGTFVFNATTVGTVNDVSNFLNIFTVLKGSTTLTYDPTSTYDDNSYRYGSFGAVSPTGAVSPVVNASSGAISISGSTGTFLSGSSVTQATFTVPIIENSTGITIAVFNISLTKMITATDGTDAIKSSLVYAWQRSSSALTTDPGAVTVDLTTGKITTTSLSNGWHKNIDDASGTDPLYIVSATAAGLGSSDTIAATEWTDPVILVRDGISPDALTVTASDVTGGTQLAFSNGTNVTIDDGTTEGVKPLYAASANPAGWSAVSETTGDFVNFYEYTGSFSTLTDTQVQALTFAPTVGENGDNAGVLPIFATSTAGANATFTYNAQKFINFYEWTENAPTEVPTGLTYIKFEGDDGVTSRAVKLISSSQVIRYSPAGVETPSDQSISFTTSIQGFSGTVTYRFLVGTTEKQAASATSTFTLDDADEPAADGSVVVKVEVYEDNTLKAVDSVTVYGIQNGVDAQNQKTVFVFKKNDNSLGFTSGNTAANQTFSSPTTGLEADWSITQPALTTDGDVVYMFQRLFTSDAASPQEAAWSGPTVVARRAADAQNQKTVFVFKKNDNSLGFTSGNTAANQTFSSPTTGLEADWSITQPALATDGDVVYMFQRLFTSDAASPQEAAWSGPVAVARQIDGDPGIDSLSVILSNESHVVPSTNAGVTTYTGSGTEISVYEGATLLDYDGSGTTNGHWTVTATPSQTSSSNNITAGAITENGNLASVAAHSAMTVTAATITYTITGKTLDGTAINITKVQSISKSQQGQKGFNSATVFIYKKTNSSTETTEPDGDTTYTFESGAVSFTTDNGWSATVPNTTESYLWVRQATAASTTATDTIADDEWSPALLLAQSGGAGVRGGSVFNFEENTNSNISADNVSRFAEVTSFTDNAAIAVAAAVIASAQDSTIRPNDRITVTDNSANIAATRVYTGGAQTNSGSVVTGNFSSLIVETFDGSVIVDGTLSADKLVANTTISNNLKVASNMVLGTSTTPGTFHSNNKSTFASTNAGFFLGATGSGANITAYKLNLGDATNYLKWDGSTLNVAGTIAMTGSSTIGSTAASTIETNANGANQDSTTDILGGNLTGTVGNTANATVANAHTTAGGSSSGDSRVYMNNNGLIVVDASGTTRVKIGNLGSL